MISLHTSTVSTTEAATALGVSAPTVRAMLADGRLDGERIRRGARDDWRVDIASIESALKVGPVGTGGLAARVARLEKFVMSLTSTDAPAVTRIAPDASGSDAEIRRLQIVIANQQEALVQLRMVQDLSESAEKVRSSIVEGLLDMVRAAEQLDGLRRDSLRRLDEVIAAFTRPGDIRELEQA